jgi:hypothetical protein
MPRLWDLDPVTGIVAMNAKPPGDMIHVDVKKLGGSRTVEAGGPTRRKAAPTTANRPERSASTTCTSLSMTTTGSLTPRSCPRRKGPTCAGFLTKAGAVMAVNGVPVRRVMTDNAFAYRLSRDFQDALAQLGAKHIVIKPRHPSHPGSCLRLSVSS